ncbi:WXG100 family type VII secretion target [Paenibacillus massiliensis]|uniref:WXG100 family type VII secretion target n=1 Tax=Paenibacillus massiliensis TaxID=225917 RepID=UPI0003FFC700|nr:WXG100 family type VII secretion target [Paenibacillus massiliensis]
MTMIKINPEHLYQIAQQVDQGRLQLEQMNRQLYGHLVSMQSLWMGMTQERFFQDYELSRPVLERALEHMVRMTMELQSIATRFSEADAEQGRYQAAIGGAVGLDVDGAASTDAGPGYRMAYNSFLGKRLPVNEQGVTDQAALQAYERDKGHLDVNAMQADVQPEPLGEDIMTLQIKAFQEGIHPFTGERVSDNYAAMMVTTLKLSQVLMGIQAIRGSMPGRKGPYRLRSNHPVVQKIQKNIEAVRAEKNMQSGVAMGNVERYSGDLVKVNKPDAAADALAVRISGQSRVKYSNDPDHREFDAVSDQYVAQSKPALQTVNKSVRNQMKATFEAAQESGKTVYYHFEGQPAQSVIDKLKEYSSRYGIEVVIDTKPLK